MSEHPVGRAAKQGPADAAAAQTGAPRTPRHRRRRFMRRRTLVGGAVLGILMLASLTLAGSLSALSTPPPAPDAELTKPIEPDTLSASQPQLEQAVLRPADLPGGSHAYSYTTPVSPKATVQHLPESGRCSLVLDPGGLLRDTHAAKDATGQASATLEGPTRVSHMLTSFARSDGASATLQEIRRVTRGCKDFDAVLDDGTPVRVHVKAIPIDENTYALRLTLTGEDRVTNGILTLRRVGNVLAVLGELGDGSIDDPLKLVDVTLNRLTHGGKG